MAEITIATYQMRVSGHPETNFANIESAIRRASEHGARMLALPECALSGYPPLHYVHAADIDVAKIARLNDEVRRLAAENHIWVILGTIVAESGSLYNTALVISDQGVVTGRYDKLHLIEDDLRYFRPGNSLPTFDVDGLTFGVLICYDVRFPEPFRYLRERGARLIVNILNACGSDTWKAPVMEGAFRTRAAENSCFVAAVNAAGPLQMCTSRICNTVGLDLASANQDREEMLFARIAPEETDSGYFYDRRADQFEVRAKFDDC